MESLIACINWSGLDSNQTMAWFCNIYNEVESCDTYRSNLLSRIHLYSVVFICIHLCVVTILMSCMLLSRYDRRVSSDIHALKWTLSCMLLLQVIRLEWEIDELVCSVDDYTCNALFDGLEHTRTTRLLFWLICRKCRDIRML